MDRQNTIKAEVTLSGMGIHTGLFVKVHLKPAPENHGIVFQRIDLPDLPLIAVCPEYVSVGEGVGRCTGLCSGTAKVYTIEHLMSVLSGLNIDNLLIEVNAEEMPGLDGSGLEYLKAIESVGIQEQQAIRRYLVVSEPIGIEYKGCTVVVLPSNDFKVSYTLDYPHPFLKTQLVSFNITPEIFSTQIAPARTFCMKQEVDYLRSKGLGKGANYQNTLVYDTNGVVENQLRFFDEAARHKVLDLIGDLYTLGMPIKGHVIALKSGHEVNAQFVKKLNIKKKSIFKDPVVPVIDASGKSEINIQGIMAILPHRYPFLLIDRVIIQEPMKKVIGIKNVSMNEPFFQGHFPNRPVMPGVLMLEAMAQTAGVCLLSDDQHRGRLAFFMSIDEVKFRKLVEPGDQLVIEVELLRLRSTVAHVRGVARVGDDVAVEADMKFAFA